MKEKRLNGYEAFLLPTLKFLNLLQWRLKYNFVRFGAHRQKKYLRNKLGNGPDNYRKTDLLRERKWI